jgi:MFS transporter, DHA2 family, multidrug resistance protein
MIGAGLAARLSPNARRWFVTVCAMTATIMQALDSTVANVSLPYMQGSLSASLDQINWVLTSYIVAAAIMTAPMAWLADRYGRKRVFIVSATGFTVASLLCAMSQDIASIVVARLLQGMFGAALVPLSQAVMLDAYPAEQRGHAMGIWGVGVMLGPIMGPTIGGFLTENYSWHWVFLINLPVGIVTVLGLMVFMEETKRQVHLRFDWFGFAALAVGIGALQLMLDRGEQAGWFGSTEIVAWLIISIAGFYYFFAHSLTTDEPFVRFEVFKDTNFLAGCLFQVVVGVGLFGTMALITPFTQHVLGYPIITAGYVLGSRGIGTMIAMIAVGRLLKYFEARTLVLVGLALLAGTLYVMIGFTTNTSASLIVGTGIIQGAGIGLIFVPLSTVSFATLPGHLRTSGAALLTLVRNLGSAIGISTVIAFLTSKTSEMHARLAEHITPFNDALRQAGPYLDATTDQGLALIDAMVTQQATVIAYQNDFKLLMIFTLILMPFVFIIKTSHARQTPVPNAAVPIRA